MNWIRKRVVFLFGSVILTYNFSDKLFGVVYILLMSNRGLTPAEIGIVLAISSLVLAIADYPSGNFADVFGRKKTMALGFIVWGTSLLLYSTATSLWGFLGALVLWSIGIAIISGTPQAWFVDELKAQSRFEEKDKYIPRLQGLSLLFGSLAGVVGGWLVLQSVSQPIRIGGIISIAAGFVIMFLLNENYGEKQSLRTSIQRNTRQLISNFQMRMILLRTVSQNILFSVFIISWQLYAVNTAKIPSPLLGPIMTVFICMMALGTFISEQSMKRYTGVFVSLVGAIILTIGLAILTIFQQPLLVAVGALIFQLGLGIESGAFNSWVHDHITSEQRASYLSAVSSVGTFGSTAVVLLAGILIGTLGFSITWSIAVLSGVIMIGCLARLRMEINKSILPVSAT